MFGAGTCRTVSESEFERFARVAGPSLTYVAVTDVRGRRLMMSENASDVLRQPGDTTFSQTFLDLVVESQRDCVAELIDKQVAGTSGRILLGCNVVLGDGRVAPYVSSGRKLVTPEGQTVLAGRGTVLDDQRLGVRIPRLSPRRLEVLHLLAEGASTREIAARLVVTEATARNHVQQIMAVLHAHSRLEAVATARRLGLL